MESDYTSVPKVDYTEISSDTFLVNDIEILPISVLHGKMPCIGYRIGNIAYITDANFIAEKEMDKLADLDILILNALRKYHHPSHFTLDESLEVIKRLKPKKAYLIHLSHHMGKHELVEIELPENVFLAYDGLQVQF
jgi:phosphoribosyl 1,2-cyclic phosphate phosphodiesterase